MSRGPVFPDGATEQEVVAMISRFPVPELQDLPSDLARRVGEIGERTGFVPNVLLALGHRPDELRAFMDYHDAVMERPGGLSKAEREMVVVATSAARSCPYCVIAHGAILRVRAKDPRISDLLATNYRLAPLTARQRAMLDYALKLSLTPELVSPEDHELLRATGFEDEEIWDISAVVALFALANRMALALDLRANPEFHEIGRGPAPARPGS